MGSYLAQPNKEKVVESEFKGRFEYSSVSMQGWRLNMEDAHISSLDFDGNDKAIFGVFDGHGGKDAALFVEKNFIKELLKNQNYKLSQYKLALEETFLRMDEIIAKEKANFQNPNSGCTANVVLIVQNKIYCANSGDSRSIISQKNIAVALSEDHKPNNPIELERIKNAGGNVYLGRINGNLNLSRALGDLEYKINPNNKDPKTFMITAFPDVTEHELTPDVNLIILGCDGIWECRTNQEIVDTFIIAQNLNQACKNFLDAIIAPVVEKSICGLDNMSIIVVKIRG